MIETLPFTYMNFWSPTIITTAANELETKNYIGFDDGNQTGKTLTNITY